MSKIYSSQKGFFVLMFSLLSMAGIAQPTVLGTQLVNGGYTTYDLNTVGGFKQYRLQATTSAAVSTRNWEFASGTAAFTNYSDNWRPNTSNNTLSVNAFIPTSFANGARYNGSFGGASGLLPAITSNNYYTFNVSNLAPTNNNVMSLLETSFNPVTISTVTNSVGTYGSRTVSITTSGTPNASENIYVRYSTNSFTSSTLVQATGSGTAWSATIPWQSSAVSFYVYTSNKSQASIEADVVTYGQGVHDMSTLNLNNNAGANYSWTPPTGNVIVSSAGGTFATPIGYSTFTVAAAAFAALNGATAGTGAVTILITGNTTETGAITLNNSANWTSIGIRPNGTRTVSGSVTIPLIDLSGADNVTIDGLNTGGNSLTISNTNTGNTSGLSTIRFIGDATNNTITNCSILGSSTVAVATNGGVIFFSTGTSTGNDNNTISNCNIGNASASLPFKLIYASGSTGSAAIGNSNVTITGCNLFDNFNPAAAHAALYLGAGNNTWNITNNKFYQTATRTVTSSSTSNIISHINVQSSGALASGGADNIVITGNTFGYANNSGTGTMTYTISSGTFAYQGIILNPSSAATSNTVSSNTFANTNISSLATSGTLYMISLINGAAIASGTFTASSNTAINIASTNSSGTAQMVLIESGSPATFVASNNNISAVSRTGAGPIYVIKITDPTTTTMNSNIINNIAINATGFTGNLMGIYGLSNSVTVTANSNTITSLTTTATGACTIGGIYEWGIAGTKTYQNNIINTLTAAGGATIYGIYENIGAPTISSNTVNAISGALTAYGIYAGGGTTYNVFKNKIYNLASANIAGKVYGLYVESGTTYNAYNNTIGDLKATATTQTAPTPAVVGMYVAGGTNANFYNNTVHLNATSSGTNFGTACIYSITSTTSFLFSNNLLVNLSTAAGTGKTAAFQRSSATLTNISASSDKNSFYSGTASAANVLYYDGTNADQTIPALKTRLSANNQNSLDINPTFVSTAGANASFLHIAAGTTTLLESGGVNNPSSGLYTDDYDGDARPGPAGSVNGGASSYDIGADEFDGIIPMPTITTLGSSTGCAGTQLIINGTNLTGATAPNVQIGGIAVSSIVSNTGTVLTVVLASGSGPVTVTIGANTATGPSFTVNPAPTTTWAASSTTVCFNASAQTTPLAYSATTNSPITYSITWNASPTNSFVPVTNTSFAGSPGGGTF